MGWKDGDKAEGIWGKGNSRGRWWTAAAGTGEPGPALGHQSPPGEGHSSQHSSPQLWHGEAHTQCLSLSSPSAQFSQHLPTLLVSMASTELTPAAPEILGPSEGAPQPHQWAAEEKKGGRQEEGGVHLPWYLTKSLLLPRLLTRQAPHFLSPWNFSRKTSSRKSWKVTREDDCCGTEGSSMPPPWLSSRSSPVIPVLLQGLGFSSQGPSGQRVMPISLMKPIQLYGINSLLLVPLRIPFFQKLVVDRGKAQLGSTSTCMGCVQTGKKQQDQWLSLFWNKQFLHMIYLAGLY